MGVQRVNLDDLDPESPEFEAAVAAADADELAQTPSAAEDDGEANPAMPRDPTAPLGEEGAEEKPEPEGTVAEGVPPTTEVQPEATSNAQSAETVPEKATTGATAKPVGGVATKDGTKVLPYAVLTSAREETRKERTARLAAEAEAQRLREENEALRTGKKPAAVVEAPSEDEVAEVAKASPKVAAALTAAQRRAQELEEENEALRTKVPAPAAPAKSVQEEVDEAIDQIPLLATWRATDPEKFARAVAIDKVEKDSPKWKGKSFAERFEAVTKKVAAEYDIEYLDETATPAPAAAAAKPSAAATTPPGRSRNDPDEVIAAATQKTPNTLSDFKGGAVSKDETRIGNLSPLRQEAALESMSDEDLERYLRRLG